MVSQSYRRGRTLLYYNHQPDRLKSILADWTSLCEPDPFLLTAKGRAFFRPQDLLELSQILKGIRS